MNISVIIPVYNASEFITKAVESALMQTEASEVILIEDCSSDNSLEICSALSKKYTKVKLFMHPGELNKGAGASRNLGIQKAEYELISFLDADDFFLPNRFGRTMELFKQERIIDGVYEAVGTVFQNEDSLERWENLNHSNLSTVNKIIGPDILFEYLIQGRFGFFHFDGLCVKKNALFQVGLFNESLRLHQDTDLMYKLAAKSKLFPGIIHKPVSMRTIHQNNRITKNEEDFHENHRTKMIFWNHFIVWGEKNLTKKRMRYVNRRYLNRLNKVDNFVDYSLKDFLSSRAQMFQYAFNNLYLILTPYFWWKIIPYRRIIPEKFLIGIKRFFHLKSLCRS
ncbi:MAG: glycosyltransferase family 2 protein [Anaerolineaceae bacterium]|nr:glycosyltransferase family 2 protein [Anaerolineaceae bacterium]